MLGCRSRGPFLLLAQPISAGPSAHEPSPPVRHKGRSLRQARRIVLLLPLANPKRERETWPNCIPNRRNNLGGKACAFLDRRSAIAIGPLVRAASEELVDEITMAHAEAPLELANWMGTAPRRRQVLSPQVPSSPEAAAPRVR